MPETSIEEVMKVLFGDCRRREEEIANERLRREDEIARREKEIDAERAR